MNRNSSGSSAILAIVASMVVAFSPATVKADVLRVDPSFGGVNMRVLLEQKRFAEARDMATARLRSAPNDGNMLAILGFAQAGLEEWQNARQSVSRAIELLPEDRRNEMRALLAEIELRAGNAETAESLLRTVLAAEPNNVRALLGLGFMYVRMDENAQAVTSFERVLGLVPDQPTALVALMELHLRSGNYAAITRMADRIGPESPSRGAGYYFQALSVLRQPEPDLAAAADLLESALSVSLSTPRVLATLGYVRLQQGRPQDAVRRLTHAVDLDAGFFDAHRLLGYGWLQLNEPRAASRHLQLALDIRESPEVRRMLGRAYLAQGDSEQGVAQLIKSLDQSEQTTNAQLELESLYQYTSGNFDQSEESLRQALANTPDAEHLRFLLIVALIKQEDFEAAAREAQIALPLFPAHSETLHNLYAMARLGSGAYDEAEAALNRALSDNPASKTTLVNLSTLYFQRGQFQRAESQLQTILENEPDDREARIRLSRVYQAARNTLAAQNVLTRGSDTVPSDGVILRELVHLKMRQREHGDALLYARAMVARYPRLFEAYVLEAQSLASLGRETDAIEVLNRGFDEAGQTQGALAVSASLARVHGWHEAAVKFLQLHNEQFGLEDPRLRKLYAIELIETGESVLAREVIQDGLSVTDPDVIFLLARSYLIEGDQARAEEFIDAALQAGVPADDIARQRIELGVSIRIKDLESDLESAPHEAPRYAALAEAHEFMGNFDAAIKAYDQGLGLTDQDLQFRAHIARLHLKNGSTQQALAIARSVADDANATTGLKFQANAVLGMAYARQGETARAERALTLATGPGSQLGSAFYELARLKSSQGETGAAISLLQSAIEIEPRSTRYYLALAALHQRAGNAAASAGVYESGIENNPAAIPLLNNLALVYLSLGENEKALMQANAALSQAPDDPNVLDTVGWVHLQSENAAEAVRYLERAVEGDPGSSLYRYHLGVGYWRHGSNDLARVELNEALQRQSDAPWAPQVREALGDIGSS